MFLEYMNKINDNKFRNFLHRIFKKKYKESKGEDGNKNTLYIKGASNKILLKFQKNFTFQRLLFIL